MIASRNHFQRINKLEGIAEVLGLIEEKGKNKDWLLDELKRNHVKLAVSPTANSAEILKSCPKQIIIEVLGVLRSDDFVVKEIQTLTKTFHWFYTDVVESSIPTILTKGQARKINLLNNLIQRAETFKQRNMENTVIMPTGDGAAIGFADSPEKPLRLAIELHKELFKYNKSRAEKEKLFIRVGINTGPVYFVKDVEGNNTFWGSGIILTRRIMELCEPNQILASQQIGEDISNLSPEYKAIMHQAGQYVTKHGKKLLIFNIYGKNFGNKTASRKNKVQKIKTDEYDIIKPNFEFNSVEIRLKVTDPKTMMTHHTWLWDVKNISKNPLQQIFYFIGGDAPKDFSEMNVTIRDEENNELEIISLDVNKEHEKKFNVKLNKPIRKNQRAIIKLEYDWEEPYRVFEYVLSSKCKKFKYELTIPKGIQIKNRVLEVARELGIKKRAEPPPKIKYHANKTVINWETSSKQILNPHDTLEFQW